MSRRITHNTLHAALFPFPQLFSSPILPLSQCCSISPRNTPFHTKISPNSLSPFCTQDCSGGSLPAKLFFRRRWHTSALTLLSCRIPACGIDYSTHWSPCETTFPPIPAHSTNPPIPDHSMPPNSTRSLLSHKITYNTTAHPLKNTWGTYLSD